MNHVAYASIEDVPTQTWDDPLQAIERLRSVSPPHWGNYHGCYSSWLNGYFREAWAMVVPMDDHGFHRGDGVFEAIRIHQGAFFDLEAHLQRLKNSARAIGMQLPKSLAEIQYICVRLAQLCQAHNGLLRLYVTRGPGGFSPNPREVVGHQIYAAITTLNSPSPALYESGARALISSIVAKDPFWSQIKSCNYLQNVMMKSECLERGYDFAVSVDSQGKLCEGATENLFLITRQDELIVPKFDYTLRGTTILVVMKLAEKLLANGGLQAVRSQDVRRVDLMLAKEVAFVGTTLGVLPVCEVEGHKVGTGSVGKVSNFLHKALMDFMGKQLRTPF